MQSLYFSLFLFEGSNKKFDGPSNVEKAKYIKSLSLIRHNAMKKYRGHS
jgi:hypothetical protein